MSKNSLTKSGLTVKVDIELVDPWDEKKRRSKATKADVILVGWAKAISIESKSKSLVAIFYHGEKAKSVDYCSSPSDSDWAKFFQISIGLMTALIERSINIIKINRTNYNRPCKRRYEIEHEPWNYCGLHKGEKDPPVCCCDFQNQCKDWL